MFGFSFDFEDALDHNEEAAEHPSALNISSPSLSSLRAPDLLLYSDNNLNTFKAFKIHYSY